MIKRLRQNRSLRASNRQKFKGDNRGNIYSETNGQDRAIFKEFPESQVKAVIMQIRIKAKAEKPLSIKVKDKEKCWGFNGIVLKNVKVQDSPEWLQRKLKSAGHSVFNNVVDMIDRI